jgi:site-specific DNA-methyltransferase (adenine-specific)
LAARLLKPGAALVAFTDIKAINVLWAACEEAGLKPLKTLHWIKPNPGPNMRQNFASAVEAAVFARKPGKILHWSGGGFSLNWFSCPVVTSDRIHETQKPVAVMAWPMRIVTPPGGLVLDPFCGSGSAGAAAIQYGFQFLGMELEETYCERARVRLARQHSQEKLFY